MVIKLQPPHHPNKDTKVFLTKEHRGMINLSSIVLSLSPCMVLQQAETEK